MNEADAAFFLKDLARWSFGQILKERSGYQGLEATVLAEEVRAYRLGILLWEFPEILNFGRNFVSEEAVVPLELSEIWFAELTKLRSAGEPRALAAFFLSRLEAKQAPSEAMRRFAFGKLEKYRRRVLHLNDRIHESSR